MKKLIRITTVPYSLGSLLKDQLRFMSKYYEVIAISSSEPQGMLEEMTKNQNARTISIKMTRRITPFRDLVGVLALYKIFKKEKPFIVHTHTPKAGLVGMMAAYFARVPHRLHTVAGLPLLETTGFKRWLLNQVEKLTYKCATKVYPNSQGLFDIILENGFTNKWKLKIIGNGSSNGIDTDHFNPKHFTDQQKLSLRTSLKIEPGDFVYIFIGRLVRDKGINELVSAFINLAKTKNNVKLLLVGIREKVLDPLDPNTDKLIETHPDIISTGGKRDVRPFLAIADALVFPSYREGFPNVVMEAGAMGLPSIVTNINGCNEIIANKKNGIIIPVKDEKAILSGMTELIENVQLHEKTKNHARKMITSRYERRHIWAELLKEYKSLEA